MGFIGKQSAFENCLYESLVCGGFLKGLYYVENGYKSMEKVWIWETEGMEIAFLVLRKCLLKEGINGKIT